MITGSQLVERLADTDVPLVGGDHETGVRECGSLSGQPGDNARSSIADVHHRDPGTHVYQVVAVDVHQNPATRRGDERVQGRRDAARHRALPAAQQVNRPRAGDHGDEPAFLGQFRAGGRRNVTGCGDGHVISSRVRIFRSRHDDERGRVVLEHLAAEELW
jgi:hypothetical protein